MLARSAGIALIAMLLTAVSGFAGDANDGGQTGTRGIEGAKAPKKTAPDGIAPEPRPDADDGQVEPARYDVRVRTASSGGVQHSTSLQQPQFSDELILPDAGPPEAAPPAMADELLGAPPFGDIVEPHGEPMLDEAPRPRRRWCGPLGAGGRWRMFFGEPLTGETWLARPISIGFFAGGYWGDQLISQRVDQKTGVLGGAYIGWAHTVHSTYELRAAGAAVNILKATFPDPKHHSVNYGLFDVDWLYSPWGDTRFRPYTRLGIGLQSFDFIDDRNQPITDVLPSMPFGVGAKYLFNKNVAVRIDFVDNLAFSAGTGLATMHNVSLTFGAELRFGGARKSYWPWNPSRYVW